MATVLRVGPPGTRDYSLPAEAVEWEKKWAAYLGKSADDVEPVVERKHSGEDIPADPIRQARFAEAVDFIAHYTGKFGLIHDLRADHRWGTKWYRLSDRQIEVVLACKARESAPKPERKQTGRDLTALPLGRTRAAVDNDSGGVTFLLIDRPGEKDRFGGENKWSGWVFVKQQQGPNEIRLGSQRPGESYAGQWANLVDKVLEDPMAAVVRYGQELGKCGICDLPLTNEESRESGIGPVCKAKLEGGLR